jgi:FAD/FMN-containing dehydrogenase
MLVHDIHSRLHPTRVAGVERPRSLADLVRVVRRARREGRPLAVCGGRHAMGGQQFGSDALLVDAGGMDRVLGLDRERGLLEVEAGIRWPALLEGCLRLQPDGARAWTFAQKQTGADRLSIGGAVSANVHGRGLDRPPFVADVESLVLVDADGELRRASREQDAELFRLAVGGYGLFGALHAVTLRLVPRAKVRRDVAILTSDEISAAHDARVAEGYAYGDFQFAIDPASDDFLRRGVFSCYRPVDPATPLSAARALSAEDWRELLYLAHADKSEGFRRYAEHYRATDGQVYWADRAQLGVYLDDYHRELDARLGTAHPATEVITELYVPRARLHDLLEAVREDLRRHGDELIYGTVRWIRRDAETFLPWAREDWACVVLNLHVEHTPAGLARSANAFRRLIDLALERGGSFYLTYHRHATREQLLACHPRLPEMLRAKLRHDPSELFQSDWYRHVRGVLAPCATAEHAR